jgi:hypothetical protein
MILTTAPKVLSCKNIESGEKLAIFRSGKIHHRSNNAESKFGTARREFMDACFR